MVIANANTFGQLAWRHIHPAISLVLSNTALNLAPAFWISQPSDPGLRSASGLPGNVEERQAETDTQKQRELPQDFIKQKGQDRQQEHPILGVLYSRHLICFLRSPASLSPDVSFGDPG